MDRECRVTAEAGDVMMVRLDTDGSITRTNDKFRDVLGYEEDELTGRNWFDTCIPERERDEVHDIHDRLLTGEAGLVGCYETPVMTRTGEERIVEWHTTALEGESGVITGTVRPGQDSTARTDDPDTTMDRYRTLLDQFPNGLVTLFDADFRYLIAGGNGFDQLDRSVGDLEGRRLEEVFPSENVEEIKPLYRRALAGESNVTEQRLGGRVFRIHVVPFRDETGDVIAGMTVSQDVTEQKERKQELETARKRYQTLLQAAPDPIFVADAETGKIIEANAAGETLRGQSREALRGLDQTELHPPADADAYRALFEEHVEAGGTLRELPDGSQMYAVTENGDKIPVEISVQTIELADGTVVYGIFRDISEQLEYERTLTQLNETARDLFEAESTQEIGQRIVETVTDVLDLAGAGFHLFDEGEGVLRPTAYSPESQLEALFGELPTFEPGEGVAWEAFSIGETAVYDDVRSEKDVYNPETPIRSEIIVPLDEHGVLIVGDVEPAAFDDQAVDFVEILGSTATAALQRADREQDLKTRTQQLQTRTQQLEELESVNARIRELAQVLVHANTRREAEQAVCDKLVEADSFKFAWISDEDPVEGALDPRVQAGSGRDYLEEISLSTDETPGSEPTVRAATAKEPTVVANTATDMAQEPWRNEALKRDFHSALSIPLMYQGTFQGTLSIYAETRSAFSERLQVVLDELGEQIAHAVVSIERKQALLANQATELEFDIQDRACFFLRFGQQTNCALELEGVIPQSDESTLVFVTIQEGTPEQLLRQADRAVAIESSRLIQAEDEPLLQLRFTEPFIGSILADQGLTLRHISADSSKCRVTLTVPPSVGIHRAVDVVTSTYEDSELLAKREQTSTVESGTNTTGRIIEKLTPRQRDVVETAYLQGYFDTPKGANGQEVAAAFEFSTSAFHHHVRAAERKLFETIFETAEDAANRSATLDP